MLHAHICTLSLCLLDILLIMIVLNVIQYWYGVLHAFQMHCCHFTCLIDFGVHLMQGKSAIYKKKTSSFHKHNYFSSLLQLCFTESKPLNEEKWLYLIGRKMFSFCMFYQHNELSSIKTIYYCKSNYTTYFSGQMGNSVFVTLCASLYMMFIYCR